MSGPFLGVAMLMGTAMPTAEREAGQQERREQQQQVVRAAEQDRAEHAELQQHYELSLPAVPGPGVDRQRDRHHGGAGGQHQSMVGS
jgi:hypothetical protein